MKNFLSNGFYEMTRDEIMSTEGGSWVMYIAESAVEAEGARRSNNSQYGILTCWPAK